MRSTLSHLSGLLFGALLAVHSASFASGQDNLLIIVADDVGVDMIGAYGEGPDPPQTPTIDQLASEGVLFRNVWANPTCSPTRAEMHTGRYGHYTGVGLVQLEQRLPRWSLAPGVRSLHRRARERSQ